MVANDAKVFTKYEFHGKQCRYFALVFGGALLGTFPGSRMPKHGHGRSGNAPGRPLGLLAKVYDPLRAFARKDEDAVRGGRTTSDCSAAAPADDCTDRHDDPAAAAIRDDFLDHEYFCELGSIFTRGHDFRNDLFCSRAPRVWRNFFDP